MTPVVGT